MGYKNAVKGTDNIYIGLYISLAAMLGTNHKRVETKENIEIIAEKYFKLVTGSKSPDQIIITWSKIHWTSEMVLYDFF